MTPSFAITYDYRCPYARIASNHVVTALRGGTNWDVTFLPFSLTQNHVEDSAPSVWEQPDQDSGILALQASIAIRDTQPGLFLDAHDALFEHRHAAAGDLKSRDVLTGVLAAVGIDTDAVWTQVDSGRPLATIEKEHTAYVESHEVWGVPTFIVGERAVFVRLLEGPEGDVAVATRTIERVLDLVEWPNLNEFKHTNIPR